MIAETRHGAGLRVQERTRNITEWMRLVDDRAAVFPAPDAPKSRGGPEGGINLAPITFLSGLVTELEPAVRS